MLKNYLKIAWRNLKQNKSYTFINFLGLAMGMTCCILIALYVKSELNYDQFNKNINRIEAVGSSGKFFGKMAFTPSPLASTMVHKVPEVDNAVNLQAQEQLNIGINKNHLFTIDKVQFTQPSFFNIFSFHLLKGNKSLALKAPNSIVLTQKTAKRIFGKKEAMGQALIWQKNDTTISLNVKGVVANPPANSSIQFDALISHNMDQMNGPSYLWMMYNSRTFALLNKHASISQLDKPLHAIARTHYKHDSTSAFIAIPLSSYHLSSYTSASGFTGNSLYLYLFGSVALFILLIACINFVNLSTGRAMTREREVGVRKTLGATRLQLMGQFIGEAVTLSVCSFLAAIYFSFLLVHPFNHLFGSSITVAARFSFLGWLFLAAIIVGILSGSYPALYLSGISPASIFGGRQRGISRGIMRKVLVAMQFAIASIFIIGSVVVYRQLHYTQHVDLGFNGKNVATFELPTQKMWQNRKNVRNIVASIPGVRDASVAGSLPGSFGMTFRMKPQSLSPQEKTNSKQSISIKPAVVDYNYLPTLGIKLIAGRNFSKSHPSDLSGNFIINKKAAQALGWTPKGAIGKTFKLADVKGKIIGVTQNFHIASLRQQIEPVALQLKESNKWSGSGTLLAKLSSAHIQQTITAIKNKLKSFAPHASFSYSFLGQKFDAMYRSDQRFGNVIGVFAFIAVFIACMGLGGLAAFAVNRRTKEIGIRKVLGASERSIVTLLSKDFLKLVALGFVIAVPIGWYAMHRWLQNFAYKINMSWWIFLLAGGIALVIALATVSWQSVRAALANPVDSLRSE
jgi:putative ABC transport system permease protein